jgi:hypothetical protein
MYFEIADPPLLLGASQEIVAVVPRMELVTFLGTDGGANTVTAKVLAVEEPSASETVTVMLVVPAIPLGVIAKLPAVLELTDSTMSASAITD